MAVLTTTEQRARARIVLLSAADLYRERCGPLLACVSIAASNDFLAAEYARRVLRGVLWELNLQAWESHPMRRRADVWRVLNTAIRWCSRRRGGYRISGRPDVLARADVPPNRQWLEWLRGPGAGAP